MKLSKSNRVKFLGELGLEYNKAGVLKFQKMAFPDHPEEWDGKYGNRTDIALRHWHNVRKYAGKNFKPEEFKCDCGGKYCNGYPTWMRKKALKNIQAIRDQYGKPMHVTSGLRCPERNIKVGGINGSKHTKGKAVDFYIKGVTDSLTARKRTIKFIKGLPNHGYTYGDGIDSNGGTRRNGMGDALHTDVK